MANPIWIVVDNGELFEGHQRHWADTFFSNATRDEIVQFCEQQGYQLEIREMTEAEVDSYPGLIEFVRELEDQYGAA